MTAILHADGLCRCGWCGTDPFYMQYHDTDWGVPEYDSRALFEKLILDGFQAGLSWITILRKRENFRAAFDGFQPEIIAGYDQRKIEALMQDAGIVRNRMKIEGTVRSAEAYLKIDDFSQYLWGFVDGKPLQNSFTSLKQVPGKTPLAEKISKDLKQRGFKFCGPTIVYAFMQACGLFNDHLVDCHRYAAVQQLVRR
jgi:DNA-3-methyladenine glycosylase I